MAPKRRAYLAWIAVCIVWGTTYFGIHVALETIPVLLVAGLRWMAAGVIMSGLMLATGRGLPKPRLWAPLALLGFLTTLTTIVLSAIPAEEEPNKPLAVAKVLLSTLALLLGGVLLFVIARYKRRTLPAPENLPQPLS